MLKFYRKLRDLKYMDLIKRSGYFDEDYYKNEYSEVKGDLLKHYYYKGYKLGNNPSSKFNNNYYLDNNSDVRNSGVNPLVHYLLYGRNEGREIREYAGMPISELYYSLYQEKYCCKVFIKKLEQERITLFLGNNFEKSAVQLVVDMIKHCEKKGSQLRIVYQNFDVDILLFELEKHKLENFSNLIFLRWNTKYLLEIYENEKIICNDFALLSMLVNTKMISRPIYYYATVSSVLDEKSQMLLSFMVQSKKVICIGNADFCSYQLTLESNYKQIESKSCNLCFDFIDMSVFMLQLYNDFFVDVPMQQINFYYKSDLVNRTICFENLVPIKCLAGIDDNDIDVFIKFSYHKDKLLKDVSCINIYFEQTKENIKFVELKNINLDDNNEFVGQATSDLEQVLKEIGIGDRDV